MFAIIQVNFCAKQSQFGTTRTDSCGALKNTINVINLPTVVTSQMNEIVRTRTVNRTASSADTRTPRLAAYVFHLSMSAMANQTVITLLTKWVVIPKGQRAHQETKLPVTLVISASISVSAVMALPTALTEVTKDTALTQTVRHRSIYQSDSGRICTEKYAKQNIVFMQLNLTLIL